MLILLLSHVLGLLFSRGTVSRIVCCAILLSYLAVNAFPIAALLRDGRGHIVEALQATAAGTGDSFGNRYVLSHTVKTGVLSGMPWFPYRNTRMP